MCVCTVCLYNILYIIYYSPLFIIIQMFVGISKVHRNMITPAVHPMDTSHNR